MAVRNAFYAQSGGVTAVISATARGLIQEARRHPERIGKVLAGRDGIIGALTEDLIDTSLESDADIARQRSTPAGAFGSCRYKLKSLKEHRALHERLDKDRLGHKYHWALADYLQCSARHLAPRTDGEQGHALGVAAVDFALQGRNAVMPMVRQLANAPCRREIGDAPLKDIANVERKMLAEFISSDGFHITNACRTYLQPLIEGEDPLPFRNGLPDYVRPKNVTVPKRLGPFSI